MSKLRNICPLGLKQNFTYSRCQPPRGSMAAPLGSQKLTNPFSASKTSIIAIGGGSPWWKLVAVDSLDSYREREDGGSRSNARPRVTKPGRLCLSQQFF